MANERVILDKKKIEIIVNRLCHQLIENHKDFSNTVLISLLPRGKHIGKIICKKLEKIINKDIVYGELDISFYRDDIRNQLEPIIPHKMDMNLSVENKDVVIIDDVLYTGRSVRSAIDALMTFGRPISVELLTLIDRRYSRHLPIQPNYVGRTIDALESEKVIVEWDEVNGIDRILMRKSEK